MATKVPIIDTLSDDVVRLGKDVMSAPIEILNTSRREGGQIIRSSLELGEELVDTTVGIGAGAVKLGVDVVGAPISMATTLLAPVTKPIGKVLDTGASLLDKAETKTATYTKDISSIPKKVWNKAQGYIPKKLNKPGYIFLILVLTALLVLCWHKTGKWDFKCWYKYLPFNKKALAPAIHTPSF